MDYHPYFGGMELGLIRKRSSSGLSSNLKRIKRTNQIFSYLVVIDFESTCWKEKYKTQEIIEFPAVLLNTSTGEVESEFHHYVQPQEHYILSDFCKELTGISQKQVDEGIPLYVCLKLFSRWLKTVSEEKQFAFNQLADRNQRNLCTFVTWSDWDLGVCLQYECRRKQLRKPQELNSWIDLRATYKRFYERKPNGLNGALQDLGITFEGREHSGLDDAKNTARLAWRMMCDGCVLTITKSLQPASRLDQHSGPCKDKTNLVTRPTVVQPSVVMKQKSNTQVVDQADSDSADPKVKKPRQDHHSKETQANVRGDSGTRSCVTIPTGKKNGFAPIDLGNTHNDTLASRNSIAVKVYTDEEKSEPTSDCVKDSSENSTGACIQSVGAAKVTSALGKCGSTSSCKSATPSDSSSGKKQLSSSAIHNTKQTPNIEYNRSAYKSTGISAQKILDCNSSAGKSLVHTPRNTSDAMFKTPSPPVFVVNSSGKRKSIYPQSCTGRTVLGTISTKPTPPMCECGRRAKRKIVQSPGPNMGKAFFACPRGHGNSRSGCGFFKWETLSPASGGSFIKNTPSPMISTGNVTKQFISPIPQPNFTPQTDPKRRTLGVRSTGTVVVKPPLR